MSHPVLDEVQCPICIDTLKKPIRVLRCGHNLCQSCLVGLCRDNQYSRCPTCRQSVLLGTNGVESLPRNHMVENMIDRLSTEMNRRLRVNSSSPSTSSEKLSLASIDRFKGIANEHMENNNYGDACNTLRRLLRETNGLCKIPHAVKQIKCLIHLSEIQEAKQMCVEIVSIFDSRENEDEVKRMCRKYDADIKEVTELFIENAIFDVPFLLIECLFKITSVAYSGDLKLIQLEMLGRLIHSAAIKMERQNTVEEIKPQRVLMEKIIGELQNTANVTMTTKCLQVTWLLKYYGTICNKTKEYAKSLSIHGQAIGAMKTVFGESACKYKVLGYCYHNLGVALRNLSQNEESNSSYIKAIEIYNSATDWLNENEKEDSILKVSGNIA